MSIPHAAIISRFIIEITAIQKVLMTSSPEPHVDPELIGHLTRTTNDLLAAAGLYGAGEIGAKDIAFLYNQWYMFVINNIKFIDVPSRNLLERKLHRHSQIEAINDAGFFNHLN